MRKRVKVPKGKLKEVTSRDINLYDTAGKRNDLSYLLQYHTSNRSLTMIFNLANPTDLAKTQMTAFLNSHRKPQNQKITELSMNDFIEICQGIMTKASKNSDLSIGSLKKNKTGALVDKIKNDIKTSSFHRSRTFKTSVISHLDEIIYIVDEGKRIPIIGYIDGKLLCFLWDSIMNILMQFDEYSVQNVLRISNSMLGKFFFAKLFTKLKTQLRIDQFEITEESLTLGIDPEFLAYEKAGKGGLADYSESVNPRHIVSAGGGEIGTDCGSLGEFRPKPSTTAYGLTQNIKELITRLNTQMHREYEKDLFIEVGGGCVDEIGGHIHFGHPMFLHIGESEIMPLTDILDDFLYFPIKKNMYGGIRLWSEIEEIECEIDDYEERNSPISSNKEITKILKKTKLDEKDAFSDYEDVGDDKYREQNWGIEYRSLPSFIGDFDFTHLVLKLAKNICLKYLRSLKDGGSIEYEKPPEKKDYAEFLSKNEVNTLWEYIYGHKKDLFLKDMIKNWNVELGVHFKVILRDMYGTNLHMYTDNYSSIMKRVFKKEMKKREKGSFEILLASGLSQMVDRTSFMIGDKQMINWIPETNTTSEKIKSWVSRISANYDAVAWTPVLPYKVYPNGQRGMSKIYRNLVFDLTKTYFDKRYNTLEKWTTIFKGLLHTSRMQLERKKKKSSSRNRVWDIVASQEESVEVGMDMNVSQENTRPMTMPRIVRRQGEASTFFEYDSDSEEPD